MPLKDLFKKKELTLEDIVSNLSEDQREELANAVLEARGESEPDPEPESVEDEPEEDEPEPEKTYTQADMDKAIADSKKAASGKPPVTKKVAENKTITPENITKSDWFDMADDKKLEMLSDKKFSIAIEAINAQETAVQNAKWMERNGGVLL